MFSPQVMSLIANEINGDNCIKHVAEISQYHRSLGSREYHEACEYIRRYLASQGIHVENLNAPLDNKTRIGNYIVPPAWEPRDAVFKVVAPEERGIVSFAETPTCINSWSGATSPEGVTAELVDVGAGDTDAHYEGKDVRGKICLVSKGYAWRTHPLAVEKYGALGFVNDDVIAFPPLKTRETFPDVVMWNTLYEREEEGGYVRGFGLTISPRNGDYLRGLLQKGKVQVYARVDTRTFEGIMENPMGKLEGAIHPEQEILMAAHVCHTRPGAIDNAAGCAHIMETLRALNALVADGKLPRPKRTIISFFGPEGHHTNVYGDHMERHGRLRDVIAGLSSHCGGDPEQLHAPLVMTRTTPARPHFIDDLVTRILEQVSLQFPVPGPWSRVPFSFRTDPRFMGGDSLQIIAWGIPAIELYRKPNIFWHTQYDTVDKCSPEEFCKSAWVFGMAAWFLANAGTVEALSLMQDVSQRSQARQYLAGLEAREELTDISNGDFQEALDRNVDLLRYLAERDTIAIGSCAELIRYEPKQEQDAFEQQRQMLVAELERKQKMEESALVNFARGIRQSIPLS